MRLRSLSVLGTLALLGLGLWATRNWRHPSPVCEDLGYELPESLYGGLHRPFHADEIRVGQKAAGLARASKARKQPLAVWLVGPSAAGKSFMAQEVAMKLGVGFGEGGEADAVLVDGSGFRKVHQGYQAVVREGHRLNCIWRQAYPALQEQVQKQKLTLLHRAAHQKQNVIIPHTCDLLSYCAPWLHALQSQGYTNHVVLVIGDRRVIQHRGMIRARATGKRYAPGLWEASVRNALEMVALATGYAELVWTTPRTRWLVRKGRPEEVLLEAEEYGLQAL
ncbi:unnamed protein product [Effrenium voratum]|uniref:Zeta toxin domain-containing protein n=1 Tax=Effrenium voratum TaxID=2562239 RepID=A0AA36HXA1_9DINO|nr:unnamed protein product [Effrenium voratum]CAJ1377044.1 unnamed protein product [Effrenium voratum]CAJ1412471.1 unnamed protein product [Effrenium voratum]